MYGYYYNAGKTWEDVKLWQATKDNDQIDVQIDTFINADNYWDIGTFKNFAEEMKQVLKADYSYPIIIDEKYELVDGAHRIVHAYLDGVKTVKAVIIDNEQWPEPDYDEIKACEMAYLQKESKAKFKIGDTIRHKEEGNVFKILDIKDGCYEFEHGVIIDIVAQDKWELAEEPKDCMYSTANFTNADRLTLCKDCKELCRYNQKTAAESLGISQEAYDEIVDKCLYGSEEECKIGVKSKEATGKLKECMDNITEESLTKARKLLQEELVNGGLDLGCGVIWKDEEPVSEEQVKESFISKHDDKMCKENGNSLTQEPVSEDLNTVAKEFANNITEKIGYRLQLRRAVCFGAKWKERQLMANAVKVNISNASIVSLPLDCNLKVGDKVLLIKE